MLSRDHGDFAGPDESPALTWTFVMAVAAILAVALVLAILSAVSRSF
jgi:hypothetical protein